MTTNFIYLVAGERNVRPGAVSDSGGLYANVGMTQNGRSPESRFRDADYRKKQAGGSWILIKKWEVGSIKDHIIHRFLKMHADVAWDSSCDNTEEFLFKTDTGDGLEAIKIIETIILEQCLPTFVRERMVSTNQELDTERSRRIEVENAEPWRILQDEIDREREALAAEMNEQLIKHQDIQDAQTQAALQDFERRSREADVKVGSMSVQLERAKQEQAKSKRFAVAVTALCALAFGADLTSEVSAALHEEPEQVTHVALDTKETESINNQTSSLEALVADYSSRLDTKSVCLRASECTAIKGRYNYNIGKNEVVCSVKVQETDYTCKYTLKIDWQSESGSGYRMINSNDWSFRLEGHTIILKDGRAHLTNAPISSFRLSTASYYITKYEAYDYNTVKVQRP